MVALQRVTAALFTGALVVVAACGDDSGVDRAKLSAGCSLNSECTSPLVCAYKRCHTQCNATRDCPQGQRCMLGESPDHVCQLPEEKTCAKNADCPEGQTCGVDKQCRDGCSTDRDCLAEQVCASGTCADPVELVSDGGLPITEALGQGKGQPCVRATDCPGNLVCKNGICAAECVTDKDCFVTWTCIDNRCNPP